MKRKISALLLGMGFALAFMTTAYAGEWKTGAGGRWWYQNDDGSYTTNGWQTIDGAYYYFDGEGYMLADTVTPDGFRVGPDGAWIQEIGPGAAQSSAQTEAAQTEAGQADAGEADAGQASAGQAGSLHSVSNISFAGGSVTEALTVSDWTYVPKYSDSTYHIFEITNNSDKTLEITITENAKNAAGQIIGASKVDQEDIPAGHTVFMENFFYEVNGVESYDTIITTEAEPLYYPVAQNLEVALTDQGDKADVTITNLGSEAIEFVQCFAVFFKDGEVAYKGTKFFKNDDYFIMPGTSVNEQIKTYGASYTDVRAHVTGRRSKYSEK